MAKDEIMQTIFPHLFSLTKNEDVSVAHFCSTQDKDDLFHQHLCPKGFQELNLKKKELVSYG
jgi:hypothetical protein